MNFKCAFIAIGLAIMAFRGIGVKADNAEDLLKQLAAFSNNENTDSSADSLIKTLLANYRACIEQLKTLQSETDSPAAEPADQTSAAPGVPVPPSPPAIASAPATPASSLRIGHVQPSGPLKQVHLAGYPALPAVSPVSSVTHPTAVQLAQRAATDVEQARIKRLLFERWDNPQL